MKFGANTSTGVIYSVRNLEEKAHTLKVSLKDNKRIDTYMDYRGANIYYKVELNTIETSSFIFKFNGTGFNLFGNTPDAISKLVIKPENPIEIDKTFLGIVIEYAKDVKSKGALEDVVPTVSSEFEAALKKAETIFSDSKATKSQVDLAEKRLTNAIWMLDFKKGDKAELSRLVEIINALDEGKYTSSSWTALQTQLEKANNVIADENAMEEEVSKTYEDLSKAFSDLELAADKSKLQGLVDNIKATDTSKYTIGTVNKFNSELDNAKAILDNKGATEEEINEAYNKLIKAYLDLRLIPDKAKLEELINKAQAIDVSKYTRASVEFS